MSALKVPQPYSAVPGIHTDLKVHKALSLSVPTTSALCRPWT